MYSNHKLTSREIDKVTLEAQKGDEKSIETLMQAFKPIVYKIASKFKVDSTDIYEDLKQEGYIGLLRAIKAFNPELKTMFTTYASLIIRNAMIDFLVKENKQVKIKSEVVNIGSNEVRKSDEEIFLFLYLLPPDLRSIISQKLGIMQPTKTYKEIAENMNLSVGQVRYKYNKSIKEIRKIMKGV
jgi:RNA polymerase sigma factor (sigma-70 family)